MLRINEAPPIEVHLIKSGEAPGGIGETGDHRAAGGPQRDLRGDRHRAAAPADRPRGAGGEEAGMSGSTASAPRRATVLAAVALVVVAAGGLRPLADQRSRAHGFRRRHTVALADYHGADPTGVPASSRHASLIERGEYLTRAADCAACHTARAARPLPAAWPSCCRSARSIRPTSPPTRTPASATGATRSS